LNLLQKLRLWLTGSVYIGDRRKEGWTGSLPFYAFRCPIHGLVENYRQGFRQELRCPKCMKKALEKMRKP